jgi:hypothetical protein
MLLRSSALTTWCPVPFKVSPRAASALARLSQSAAAEFRSLDQEIRSVFVPDYIITAGSRRELDRSHGRHGPPDRGHNDSQHHDGPGDGPSPGLAPSLSVFKKSPFCCFAAPSP